MKKSLQLGSVLAALVCASVVHAADDTLLLTQTSDTDLSVQWDGGTPFAATLLSTSPFVSWGFLLPDLVTGLGQWADPGAPGDVNTLGAAIGGGLSFAEVPYIAGVVAPNDTVGGLFVDLNGPVDVTFDDAVGNNGNNGNGNIPDSTTTMPLLGLAFAGLCGFAKRFRK